jgi:acyl-CoA synthetase (AMP-forming)/AMP-acid ligase II
MLKADELAVLLGNLRPRLLFCDPAHLEVCRAAVAGAKLDSRLVLLEGTAVGIATLDEMLQGERYGGPHPTPADIFEISYTSGTTSAPKGVALTHDAVLHRGRQEVELFRLDHTDAAIVVTPLFHQSGIRDTVLPMWLVGGHAVVAAKFSARDFWPMVKEYRATYGCVVETILLFLAREPATEAEQFTTMRRMLGVGDPELSIVFEDRFDLRLVNVYGMTELGVPVRVPLETGRPELNELRRWGKGRGFLAGWPMPGTELRLMDESGLVAGEGATGEIQIRSRNLLREYWRDPKATEAAFVDGWFKTGDMGIYGPRGALYFVDRIKDVIRRGGENIASKQVEDVLHAHPEVQIAAVVPVPDPLFMQEVKAVVVPRPGARPTADALWQWCEERLARYKVPRYIELRDALPTTGSGRIQKQVLRAEGVAGAGEVHDRRKEAVGA